MDTNPTLYVVTKQIGGFAREDAPESNIVGCYTDQGVARNVALATSSKVVPVELNTMSAGLLSSFSQLGLKFDPASLTCTISTSATSAVKQRAANRIEAEFDALRESVASAGSSGKCGFR